MRGERLEREPPRLGIKANAPERPQGIAERDEMRAGRAIRTERRGDKQNCAADLAALRRFLQAAEEPRLRQKAAFRRRRAAGIVPKRDRNILAERVEHGDEALQHRPRQMRARGDLDTRLEGGAVPAAGRIERAEQKLPALHGIAAILDPGPGGLALSGQRGDADTGLGKVRGLGVAGEIDALFRQGGGDGAFDAGVARAGEQCIDGLGAELRRVLCGHGDEQLGAERRSAVRRLGKLWNGLPIDLGELIPLEDVEGSRPLCRCDPLLGRKRCVARQKIEILGACLRSGASAALPDAIELLHRDAGKLGEFRHAAGTPEAARARLAFCLIMPGPSRERARRQTCQRR